MANKRMLSRAIVASDRFLDLPPTAQLLYFHLNMRADDEGFVDGIKGIQRSVCCTDNDFIILVSKGFLLDLGDSVAVIRHWRVHNTLRKDRCKSTLYTQLRNKLNYDINGIYFLKENGNQSETNWQPNGNQNADYVKPSSNQEKTEWKSTCSQNADSVKPSSNQEADNVHPCMNMGVNFDVGVVAVDKNRVVDNRVVECMLEDRIEQQAETTLKSISVLISNIEYDLDITVENGFKTQIKNFISKGVTEGTIRQALDVTKNRNLSNNYNKAGYLITTIKNLHNTNMVNKSKSTARGQNLRENCFELEPWEQEWLDSLKQQKVSENG